MELRNVSVQNEYSVRLQRISAILDTMETTRKEEVLTEIMGQIDTSSEQLQRMEVQVEAESEQPVGK